MGCCFREIGLALLAKWDLENMPMSMHDSRIFMEILVVSLVWIVSGKVLYSVEQGINTNAHVIDHYGRKDFFDGFMAICAEVCAIRRY